MRKRYIYKVSRNAKPDRSPSVLPSRKILPSSLKKEEREADTEREREREGGDVTRMLYIYRKKMANWTS